MTRILLALCAFACALPAATGTAADVSFEAIPELTPDRLDGADYRRFVLALDGAPPDGGGLRLTIGVLDGEPVQIWALSPKWGSQRLIARTGSLEVRGSQLAGSCYVLIADPFVDKLHYKSCKRGGAWWRFDLEVTAAGERVQGRWSCERSNPRIEDKQAAKGALAGAVIDRAALDRLHPLVRDADYPSWRGDFGNGTATDTGEELVADFADAAVCWVSEESELPGTYNIVMGGLGGPVVADGKVYCSYQMPNGPTIDREWYAKLMPDGPEGESRISYYGHLAGDYGAEWLARRTSVEADDVVLCVDAQTGLTLWKRVFPAAARNPSYSGRSWSWAKNGPFTTPCIADGRLYTVGGHGKIYCLDAETGEDVWHGGLPSSAHAEEHLAAAVAEGRMVQRVKHKPGAPDYCVSPQVAEGVMVINDNGSRVHGYDARTGERVWGDVEVNHIGRGRGGGAHSGVLMALGDRTLMVMGSALISPRDGKVLWDVPKKYFGGELGNACVSGDVIVFVNGTKNDESDVGISGWRVTESGVEQLWEHDDRYCSTGFATPTIYRGHCYATTRPKDGDGGAFLCIELATGKIVAEVPLRRGEGSIATLVAGDGRLLVGQQHGSWWRTDPANFERLSDFPGGDSVPNNQSSHPQAMCGGRLYSRGDFNLVCWDLRAAAAAR